MSKVDEGWIDLLVDRWAAEEILNPIPATSSEIDAFEKRHGVTLPPSVRSYILRVNGTIGGRLGMDDDMLLGFWHIDEIEPHRTHGPEGFYSFADYSIRGFDFCVRLTEPKDVSTSVLRTGTNPVVVTPTLPDFFMAYLGNDWTTLFGESG